MIRRIFIAAVLALASLGAWAQLTPAQLQTLKAAILTETDPGFVFARTNGQTSVMAAWFNGPSAFIVWRTSVTNEEIGDAFNGTEIAGLASLPMQRLQVLAAMSNGTQNPSRFDRRDAFDRIFSGAGGQLTRAALAIVWRRAATRGEALYATGTGTAAVPGALVFQGSITDAHISAALEL